MPVAAGCQERETAAVRKTAKKSNPVAVIHYYCLSLTQNQAKMSTAARLPGDIPLCRWWARQAKRPLRGLAAWT